MQIDFLRAEHIHISGLPGNGPRHPDAEANVIHIADARIDKLCVALKFDEQDRKYMRAVFRRHEAGEATLPERVLVHLMPRLVSGCVIVSFE
jgi:hypothetical protein